MIDVTKEKPEKKFDLNIFLRVIYVVILLAYPIYSFVKLYDNVFGETTTVCNKIDTTVYYNDTWKSAKSDALNYRIMAKVFIDDKEYWKEVTMPEFIAGKQCYEKSPSISGVTLFFGIVTTLALFFVAILIVIVFLMASFDYITKGKLRP